MRQHFLDDGVHAGVAGVQAEIRQGGQGVERVRGVVVTFERRLAPGGRPLHQHAHLRMGEHVGPRRGQFGVVRREVLQVAQGEVTHAGIVFFEQPGDDVHQILSTGCRSTVFNCDGSARSGLPM